MLKQFLLLVDHGSRRDEANRALGMLAVQVGEQLGAEWFVTHAHMELAEPSIDRGIATCQEAGADSIVVQPYFLSKGRHVTQDIPTLVRAAAEIRGLRFTITEPTGSHALIASLIAAIAREAATEPK